MSSTETLNNFFTFSSTEGQQLVRKILVDGLPFEPHNDQIAGVCKTLDGIDILIVSATGSGKTGYFFMVLIVIIAINNNPQLCPSAKFKKDPAMIVLLEGCQVRQSTLRGSTRETGLSYLRCTEVGT
jgi:hypothetical protein